MGKSHDPDDDVSSGAHANTEDSRLGSSGRQLLTRLLGPLADEMGIYLADSFRQWRWRKENFEKVAQRCEMEKKARIIDDELLMPVSEGDAYRLTDACSFEDNETMQELWAGLIISSMDRNKTISGLRAFTDILKAIGPVEAGLLLVLYEISFPPSHSIEQNLDNLDLKELDQIRRNINQKNDTWMSELRILSENTYRRFSDAEKDLAIQNLFRLRCIGLRVRRNLNSRITSSALPLDPGQMAKVTSQVHGYLFQAVDYLEWLTLVDSGIENHKQIPDPITGRSLDIMPELQFQLTGMGSSLVSACMTDVLRRKVRQET